MYPGNTISAFTVHLSRPIEVGTDDRWEVGVTEITWSPKNVGTCKPSMIVGDTIAMMYCDLITPQFIGVTLARVIRTFTTPILDSKYYFENVYYVLVEKRTFQDIRIEILELQGRRIPLKTTEVPMKVVLHFRRVTKC
jgi:hypothetical protein